MREIQKYIKIYKIYILYMTNLKILNAQTCTNNLNVKLN